MHPENEALQAQLNAANNILRHVSEWMSDAAFGPTLTQIRREVLGYFGMEPAESWLLAAMDGQDVQEATLEYFPLEMFSDWKKPYPDPRTLPPRAGTSDAAVAEAGVGG